MTSPSSIRLFIVDDEPPAVERLADIVSTMERVEVAGCESRAERALERCRRLLPDAVLLDIEMPGMDGLAMARQLRRLDPAPAVIFVTAHDNYAIDAFSLAATDYVVKPVRAERLRKSLDRVLAARSRGKREWIGGRIGERLVRMPIDRVRAFTAEAKCALAHGLDHQAVVDDSLVALQRRYGARFIRVHRNALVSRDHVRSLYTDRDEVERVEIEGIDLRPEVSRRNRAALKKLLDG